MRTLDTSSSLSVTPARYPNRVRVSCHRSVWSKGPCQLGRLAELGSEYVVAGAQVAVAQGFGRLRVLAYSPGVGPYASLSLWESNAYTHSSPPAPSFRRRPEPSPSAATTRPQMRVVAYTPTSSSMGRWYSATVPSMTSAIFTGDPVCPDSRIPYTSATAFIPAS